VQTDRIRGIAEMESSHDRWRQAKTTQWDERRAAPEMVRLLARGAIRGPLWERHAESRRPGKSELDVSEVLIGTIYRGTSLLRICPMDEEHTTMIMERFLSQLANLDGSASVGPTIEALIDSSVSRLHLLCRTLLVRSYPRLARPPLNLQPEELLSAVVDRLLRALREIRPTNVRQFFALANRHMRWELNDLARRLDKEMPTGAINEELVESPVSDDSELSPNARRILDAVEGLPDEEREAFDLMRIQNLSQPEAAEVLGVSESTLRRRLQRGLLLLTQQLSDLEPSSASRQATAETVGRTHVG
jgi:RNA polymerase sigma factor (sigma-70 family)